MKEEYLDRKKKLLDGRLKTENYLEDVEENLEENLEEEPGQNYRLEKKDIERKRIEEIEKEIEDKLEDKEYRRTKGRNLER